MKPLFNIDNLDTSEIEKNNFIRKIKRNGIIWRNKSYVNNYISASAGIMINHIKSNYDKFVIGEGWEEEKFENITFIIIRFKRVLSVRNYSRYGKVYDEGKLTKIAREERYKYYHQ